MSTVSRRRTRRFLFSWPLNLAAVLLALSLVWVVDRVVVARGLANFQKQLTTIAAHLSEGEQRNVALGALMTAGRIAPIARDTASGKRPPDNDGARHFLQLLDREFGLINVFILNAKGVIVAYQADEGANFIGRYLGFRPYFRSAISGTPYMYAALGANTGERGIYIAAPIFEQDAAPRPVASSPDALPDPTPGVVGVLVGKLGFDEIDRQLEKQDMRLAVVSPEGIIFASNRRDWLYRVICEICDMEAIRQHPRAAIAYRQAPPQKLPIDGDGWLHDGGTHLKIRTAEIDWKTGEGTWRLVGFDDPAQFFGIGEQFAVAALGYALVMLFGAWRLAQRRVLARTAELELANRQLAELSTTDALTGLANRRRFDQMLTEEWLRARRTHSPLALMMIDVDHFKQYNDHYGHQQGDECLRTVAAVIQSHAKRTGDLAARYGGEEFCLLLGNTDGAAAKTIAETLRAEIETLAIEHAKAPSGQISISLGVAVMPAGPGMLAEPLIASADKALYEAKRAGRNRVVMTGDPV